MVILLIKDKVLDVQPSAAQGNGSRAAPLHKRNRTAKLSGNNTPEQGRHGLGIQ